MGAKLLVLGGNGHIGARVCRAARAGGYDVVSVARRGPPAHHEPWMSEVVWHGADVMQRESWVQHLADCTAVVHCIGIARERPERGETFKRINGDSAILAGEEAARAGVRTFVFLSAAEKPAFVHEEYLSSKRRAELALQKLPLRVVIFRPGIVYGAARPLSVLAGQTLRLAGKLPSVQRSRRYVPPVHVDVVARAVVRAANGAEVHGVLDARRIVELGS